MKQAQAKTNYYLLTVAVFFWLANVFLHLEFSFWITTPYSTGFGDILLRDFLPTAGLIVSLILLGSVYFRARSGHKFWLNITAWLVLLVFCWIAIRFLLTTEIESIHFFQYAIVSYLFCLAFDSEKRHWPLISISVLVCTLGVIDELNQYMGLAASYGTYLDFNDFLLNQLGAMLGLLLFYGFSSSPRLQLANSFSYLFCEQGLVKKLGVFYVVVTLLLAALVVAGLIGLDPETSVPPGGFLMVGDKVVFYLQREPHLFDNWQTSFSGGLYYILGVGAGIGLLAMSTALVAVYKYLALTSKD